MTRTLILATAAAALCLAGCGKVGTLEQPAPLYGAKAKAEYRARKAAAAEAAAQQRRDDAEIESLPPEKTYDPNADPSSSRYLPIPGAPAAPNGPPPQGVLPDPYNHPQ